MSEPLLDKSQRDQELRDLMPIVEWLTNADIARSEGMGASTIMIQLFRAYDAFRAIPYNSPAVKAYMRWLQQNTDKEQCRNPSKSPSSSKKLRLVK